MVAQYGVLIVDGFLQEGCMTIRGKWTGWWRDWEFIEISFQELKCI